MNTFLGSTRLWLVGVCLVLAACGSAAAESAADGGTGGVGPEVEQKIARCLGEAGFEPTPPDVDEDGAFVAALEQCVRQLGVYDEFFDEPGPAEREKARVEQNETTVAYVACLRDRGWRVPDPVADADGFLVDQDPVGLDGAQRTAFSADVRRCGERTLGAALEDAQPAATGHDDHGAHDHAHGEE